jgi:hypothetical protein
LREEARRALKLKRLMHRGLDAEAAARALAAAELTSWELRRIDPSTIGSFDARGRRSNVVENARAHDADAQSCAPPIH